MVSSGATVHPVNVVVPPPPVYRTNTGYPRVDSTHTYPAVRRLFAAARTMDCPVVDQVRAEVVVVGVVVAVAVVSMHRKHRSRWENRVVSFASVGVDPM